MAQQTDALAHIYADSLLELARNAGGDDMVTELGDELDQIVALADEDPSLREFLASPIIAVDDRAESLRRIFADRVHDLTLRFLLVLNRKGRLGHLRTISHAYAETVQEAAGRIDVEVITPLPIEDDLLHRIGETVRTMLDLEPVVQHTTRADMIGGIQLRIGDRFVDGSVATRIRSLRQSMMMRGGSRVRSRIDDIIDQVNPEDAG